MIGIKTTRSTEMSYRLNKKRFPAKESNSADSDSLCGDYFVSLNGNRLDYHAYSLDFMEYSFHYVKQYLYIQ